MILFSSNKLQKALADDSLDSWDKAKYIIFVIAMYTIYGPFYWFMPSFGEKKPMLFQLASFASYLFTILITIYGAKRCFKTNKIGDGKDFVERFDVLFVPMTFEILPLALLLLAITFYLAEYVVPYKDEETKRTVVLYCMLLCAPILTWLFYTLLDRDFERIRVP